MKRTSILLAGVLLVGLPAVARAANGPDPGPVRTALIAMHAWAQSGGQREGWRAFLLSDVLEAELARGLAADRLALAEVFDRYASGAPGTASPPIVAVRQALETYLRELASAQIAALATHCANAKTEFHPLGPSDAQPFKQQLVHAADRLALALQNDPDRSNATGWAAFLQLSDMQAELRNDQPDLGRLDAIYARFASGQEGLELALFAEVRRALRQYLLVCRAAGHPELKKQYETVLDRLTGQLDACSRELSSNTALSLSRSLAWLEDAQQAAALRRSVAEQFAHPNVCLRISGRLLDAALGGVVDQTGPVEDVILSTVIRGTDHTRGRAAVELVPSLGAGELDIVFRGVTETKATGYSSGAVVQSTSVTHIGVRKRLRTDGRQITSLPAQAAAQVETTLHSVDPGRGGWRAQQEAWRRAEAERETSDRIAEEHARQRAAARMDQEVGQQLEALQAWLDRWCGGLEQRAAWPRSFRAYTTAHALHWTAVQAHGSWLASPLPPPVASAHADLVLQLHESAVNNTCARLLGGMVLREDRLGQWLAEVFGPLAPRFAPPAEGEPWTVQLAQQFPVTVRFEERQWAITLRGDRYTADGREFPELDITLIYQIEPAGLGWQAVRQGELRVYPRGFVPGQGAQLSARQQALRNILQRRLSRLFDERWSPGELKLPAPWERAGPLELVQWDARQGWMTLAWRRKIPEQPP